MPVNAGSKMHLRRRSVQEYRAAVMRRALRQAAYRAVVNRAVATLALVAAGLVLDPVSTARDDADIRSRAWHARTVRYRHGRHALDHLRHDAGRAGACLCAAARFDGERHGP